MQARTTQRRGFFGQEKIAARRRQERDDQHRHQRKACASGLHRLPLPRAVLLHIRRLLGIFSRFGRRIRFTLYACESVFNAAKLKGFSAMDRLNGASVPSIVQLLRGAARARRL